MGEIHLQYEPGATQRADLGTKPFTKERLSQLIKLWNIIDRRTADATVRAASATPSPTWLSRLLMFCQLCGVTAQKEQIQAEVPWDLYLVVLVLAIAVIGIWEGGKHCCRGKEIRLQALRSRASYGKLTRAELKELQRLLALEPGDLTGPNKVNVCSISRTSSSSLCHLIRHQYPQCLSTPLTACKKLRHQQRRRNQRHEMLAHKRIMFQRLREPFISLL